jgi:hypothetical protein
MLAQLTHCKTADSDIYSSRLETNLDRSPLALNIDYCQPLALASNGHLRPSATYYEHNEI